MRLKNIIRLVSEDDGVILPIDSTGVGDKDTNLSILTLHETMIEEETCSNLVSDTDNVINTLTEMNDVIKNIDITDPTNCITPHEADTINILVEHLKRSIKYKGNKRFPSMENFGGRMSRSKAHRVAIEDLESLCNEIKISNRARAISRHGDMVKTSKKMMTAKAKLIEYINKTIIESNDFYTSGKYQPSLNGSDLIPKSYVKYIFTLDESLDGKMPSVAILNGLKSIKSNMAAYTLLSHLNTFKAILDGINKSSLTEESNAEYMAKIIAFNKELIQTHLPFSRMYEYSKDDKQADMHYPLSDTCITCNMSSEYNYFTVTTGCLPDNIKLGALSDQESNTILTDSLSIVGSFEIDNLLVECIELCISNTERFTGIDNIPSYFTESCTSVIELIHKLSYIEITIVNGLVDYCKDSIDSLNKKVIDTGIK